MYMYVSTFNIRNRIFNPFSVSFNLYYTEECIVLRMYYTENVIINNKIIGLLIGE